jgi:outer membrane lipoprotein-sorting protein
MIKKIFFILFFLSIYNSSTASIKDKIIDNLNNTNNFSFEFKQTIDNKNEIGYCIIQYPKKIFCSYNNKLKKIIVSNGNSLVIKNRSNNQYYIYPINRTPLAILLNKKYLIDKIKNLTLREIDNKYFNFTLLEKENVINIFFDKETLNLVGWQTEDIYKNLVITFISNIKINNKISDQIFKLPKIN